MGLYAKSTISSTPCKIKSRPTVQKIPKNLPVMNETRPTGLDSTVNAVRPSISSAISVLAAQMAWNIAAVRITRIPDFFIALISSPKVLNGQTKSAINATTPNKARIRNTGWAVCDLNVAKPIADSFGAANRGTR